MNRINNEIELRAPEEKIENQSKRFLNLVLKTCSGGFGGFVRRVQSSHTSSPNKGTYLCFLLQSSSGGFIPSARRVLYRRKRSPFTPCLSRRVLSYLPGGSIGRHLMSPEQPCFLWRFCSIWTAGNWSPCDPAIRENHHSAGLSLLPGGSYPAVRNSPTSTLVSWLFF